MAGATLGCGSYEAYVLPRGGGDALVALPWNTLSWGRRLDDTSDAAVTIGSDCCDLLAGIYPWRHELAVYRDGALAWVGPIIDPSAPVQGDHRAFQIAARDLSAWWDHRRIHDDHSYAAVDLATIFQDFAEDAMSVDPSPGLVVATTPCGVLGTQTVLGSQHQMAGLALRDLSSTGIDWTLVGRQVIAGGAVVPTGSIGVFLDDHFAVPPSPSRDGTAQANVWGVRGAGGGTAGDVVYGEDADAAAGALDGVLESVETIASINDNVAAKAAAQTRVALTSAILSAEQSVLDPAAPFTIDELVPGALCTLALQETCIPIFGQYRLQGIDVRADGSGGDEVVALTFQPIGTV